MYLTVVPHQPQNNAYLYIATITEVNFEMYVIEKSINRQRVY